MLLHKVLVAAVSAALAAPAIGGAGVIDFETTPGGGAPTDDAPLTGSYLVDGVTISFDLVVDGQTVTPVFELVGRDAPGEQLDMDGDPIAFGFANSELGQLDTADVGFEDDLGQWFLRTPAFTTCQGPGCPATTIVPQIVFTINYSSPFPVTEASGEIWDIDSPGTGQHEQWTIDALGAGDVVLATVLTPEGIFPTDPASLDARPFVFSFVGLTDIQKVRLTHTGPRPNNIGLAFNNYSPVTSLVPEPAALALLGAGLALLALRRRAD
jgi:hypothetical protein